VKSRGGYEISASSPACRYGSSCGMISSKGRWWNKTNKVLSLASPEFSPLVLLLPFFLFMNLRRVDSENAVAVELSKSSRLGQRQPAGSLSLASSSESSESS